MFRSEIVALGFVLAGFVLAGAVAVTPADAMGLGRTATPAEIAAWDIDARPDGQGLPEGRGSVREGEAVYEAKCANCHGSFGDSQEYMALAGGVGSLVTTSPQRTVGSKLDHATTLFDYIYRAMPFNYSKSLSANELYAVTAYVLSLNDILPADAVLDRASLSKVQMPNRNGYTTEHGFGTVHGKPDVRNTACMNNCETKVTVASALPAEFVKQLYGDISDDFRRYDPAATRQRVADAGVSCSPDAPDCAAAAIPADKLIDKYSCTVCHAIDHQLVGPAYRDVSARYAADPEATAMLLAKVVAGGSGSWGEIPMPAQSTVPAADLKSIIHWILELKK